MSPKDQKFDNLTVFDLSFLILSKKFRIDYLNEIFLMLDGKTRFFIFKQTLFELEGKTDLNPISKIHQYPSQAELGYLHEFNGDSIVKKKMGKIRRQYKGVMRYLARREQLFPLKFVDELKKKNETSDDFLLKWCYRLRKNYKRVYLATNNPFLQRDAKKSKINIIFINEQKFLTIEKAI